MSVVHRFVFTFFMILGTTVTIPGGLSESRAADAPEYTPHADVLKGFEKVVTRANIRPMYTLWTREKDGQVYAELPRGFADRRYFMAMTIASGEEYAGLQAGDLYVYWRQYDRRLALIAPNVQVRATGDREAESSVKRLFTDRILLDVPIVTLGPGGGPVIDMDSMLLNHAQVFFGSAVMINPMQTMNNVFSISRAKAFENNIEIAFEVPMFSRYMFDSSTNGVLKQLHFSISDIPDNTGYQPRVADTRIGYFTTTYTDLAKYNDRETAVRYINRWHIEKADPKLKLSPPKRPIEFIVEHTTPIRYRRWVREGVLAWNKAFEKVGISEAIVVLLQDEVTKQHMDKDPEDVNYNFIRWLNNNIGTAIGPSRVHPLSGQILDADIILTDGWIRHYQKEFSESLPKVAMEGFSPDTLAWLAQHPKWDPRIRLADPAARPQLARQIAMQAAQPQSGHPLAVTRGNLIGTREFDGLMGRHSQINGMCVASDSMSFDLALMRMTLDLMLQAPADPAKPAEPKKPEEQQLDGMPESFVGPLIAHLVAHEVGHTLGLRHNFKASSILPLTEINSPRVKGQKQLAGSVMDYLGTNISMNAGETQGDYCMSGIGPYDMWAIEYGYTFDDVKPILARVAEPELVYGTDEDTFGPDPLARRYDFSSEPLDYAENQIRLSRHHRDRLLTNFIADGDSWDRIRYGYELTLSLQMRAVSMMSGWVGGAFIHRDKKGDPNGRKPVEVVSAERQRKALMFVINNAFNDAAFGLTPELVTAMGLDKWSDDYQSMFEDTTWPIHDRIMGIQAAALTRLMNPTTLQRVYDNEFRVPADQEMLTLPEMLTTISESIWSELDGKADGTYSARKPLISSLRRNLQREHLERLIDLTLPGSDTDAASRTISMLASERLRQIVKKIEATQAAGAERLDQYTVAHLAQARERIQKALDADYILNPSEGGGSFGGFFMLGNEPNGQQGTLIPVPAGAAQRNSSAVDQGSYQPAAGGAQPESQNSVNGELTPVDSTP